MRTTADHRRRTERRLALVAVITIVLAWIIGARVHEVDLAGQLPPAWPGADEFVEAGEDSFEAFAAGEPVGFVLVGEATGYGGDLTLAVGIDHADSVVGVTLIDDSETAEYLDRVRDSGFLADLVGLPAAEAFDTASDATVSGATYTVDGLADAIVDAARAHPDGDVVPAADDAGPAIVFGFAEITLLTLYVVAGIGHLPRLAKHRTAVRWTTRITGLVVIGFLLNAPLTLSRITSLLLGVWPEWQTSLYWYLLLGGIVLIFTVEGKNAYCAWWCPFGAAQDVLGALGGGRRRVPVKVRRALVWTQRGVAWAAIVIALLLRDPGSTSYEVFGTLFALTGSGVMLMLLGIVLMLSLVMKRPWCHFLCPLDPIYDFIRLTRTWIGERWTSLIGSLGAISSRS